VFEHNESGTGEGKEEDDDEDQDERCGDDGHGPWRAPKWEAIPIGTQRAKVTRLVELSMQRDCALMVCTLEALVEAAKDRVDQYFYLSRWIRDSDDTRLCVAAESQRRMLRSKQRLLCAEAAEARRARGNKVNNSAVSLAETRRVAHPSKASADNDAALAARCPYTAGRVVAPSQTPSASIASARAAAAAASTGVTTGLPFRAPSPVLRPLLPPPPVPPPPPPTLPPTPSPQLPPPLALPTGREPPVTRATPQAPQLCTPSPPLPLERVFLPLLVSPAAVAVICISSGASSVAEHLPGVAAVNTISRDDSSGREARVPVASRPEADGNAAFDADGDTREAAKCIVDAKLGTNTQAAKLRNNNFSGLLTSGPDGAPSKGRLPPSRCRGAADVDHDADVPDIEEELLDLALRDTGQENDGTGEF